MYEVRPWLTLDADVAWSRARFTDVDPAGRHIPGALGRVIAAGLTVHERGRVGGSLRLRHFGPRALTEDGMARSRRTTIVNGQIGLAINPRTRLVLDAFNLFDPQVSDIEYFYTSRLPGEPAEGVAGVHSHPALPRSVRLGLQIGL